MIAFLQSFFSDIYFGFSSFMSDPTSCFYFYTINGMDYYLDLPYFLSIVFGSVLLISFTVCLFKFLGVVFKR